MNVFMVIVIIAEIALFSFTPIYGLIAWRRSKKRMKSGDDKQKLKDLVYSIIKCDEEFKVVYAYWYEGYRPKWHRYYRFTYWYFAIGFNENYIYIVPFQFDKGEILYKEYRCIKKNSISKIDIEKNTCSLNCKIYDRDGQLLEKFIVCDDNSSMSSSGNIDLYQKEEFDCICALMEKWAGEVPVKETNNSAKKNKLSETDTVKIKKEFVTYKEMERCLLQQTPNYKRGTHILFAFNENNEFFLIYFMPITFYVVKVIFEEEKGLRVVYDYRRQHNLFEELIYEVNVEDMHIALKIWNRETFGFTVPKVLDYKPWGLSESLNQSAYYNEFAAYIGSYQSKITEYVNLITKENTCEDILKITKKISDEYKKEITGFLEAGDKANAMRKIQACTGLGLKDVATIAEDVNKYF